jgi:nitrate/TMAO reductase-like tetraheme cytochrome c subunit
MNARAIAGVLVLALGAWALVAIFHEPAKPHAPVAWESSAQCAECHADVSAEWQQSWHAQAWNDEEVRKLSENFSNTDCIDCHAPQPVFETGIGNRPLARSTRRAEGVDCISCHQMKDGRVRRLPSERAARAHAPRGLRRLPQPARHGRSVEGESLCATRP